MSERKVLNKYYPPDFDPAKIPKLRLAKNRQYSIRVMAPCNMKCNTCGEYIYKGKKFNSRKETVEDEDYLGLRIFRFYIKCPRCVAEIAFKTDLVNTDYTLEAGATRNFEASKKAEQMAIQEQKDKEEEELNNPMKVLENRTKASRNEMEQIDTLEELRDINSRHAKVENEHMVKLHRAYDENLLRLQEEEDEKMIQSIFGEKGSTNMKRLNDSDSDSDDATANKIFLSSDKPTDILTHDMSDATSKPSVFASKKSTKSETWKKSIGGLSSRESLSKLVVKKKPVTLSSSDAHKEAVNRMIKSDQSEQTSVASSNNGEKDNNIKISSALGMLGDYSDSESGENSD